MVMMFLFFLWGVGDLQIFLKVVWNIQCILLPLPVSPSEKTIENYFALAQRRHQTF